MKTLFNYSAAILFLATGLALIGLPSVGQTIRYVTPTGTGDGSSWANASGNLRATLLASSSGNQIWVAAGTYKPTTGTDRTLSFSIPSGVQVYGGFVGTETGLSQRRLNYPLTTVLSGEIGGAAVADNTYHVVTFRNAAMGTLLDGFVIRDGGTSTNTESPIPPGGYTGGGIYNESTTGQSSSPSIQNCYVTNNRGAFAGGGMFNAGSGTVTLKNCIFRGNYGEYGGAVYSTFRRVAYDNPSDITLTVINCDLVSNACLQAGKAITGGRLNIQNSILWNNQGTGGPIPSVIQDIDYANSRISYSIIQEGSASGTYVSGTVLNVDPLFVMPFGTTPDYRLQATSPAINAGDPAGTGLSPTDLAGNIRIASGRVDMGPLEFGSSPPAAKGLTLLAPIYDCKSGAFTFRTSGGDGSLIEYQAPAITGWSMKPNQFVDRETRTACDAGPILLQARYVGRPDSEVRLVWNIRAVCPCYGARLGASTETDEAGLVVRVLGNPITDERVAVEIMGATDQSLQLKTTDIRGRMIEEIFVKAARSHEQHWLNVGSSAGLYFLQVATPHQTRTVKVIRE